MEPKETTNNEAESATLPTKEEPIESPKEFVPDQTTGPKPDDMDTRVKNFNEGLAKLQKEHELTLTAEAEIVNGMVFARPKVVDSRLIELEKKLAEQRAKEGK